MVDLKKEENEWEVFKGMQTLTVETDEEEPKVIARISSELDSEGRLFFAEEGYRIRCSWKRENIDPTEHGDRKHLWYTLAWTTVVVGLIYVAFNTNDAFLAAWSGLVAGWDTMFALENFEKYCDPRKVED